MRARLTAIWILSSLAAIATIPASATTFWIGTEPAAPEPGESITIRLFAGDDFPGEERPFRAEETARFQRLWRSGRSDMRGAEGLTPAARFVGEESGVFLVAYDTADARSFSKALVVVGSPKTGDPLRWSELGQRLEIVPQSDPVELARRAGALELQVLFEREPLAGALVTAAAAGDPTDVRTARTDEIGMARLTLESPGGWLITTSHSEAGRASLDATLYLAVGGGR